MKRSLALILLTALPILAKENARTMSHAKGTFEVKLTPQSLSAEGTEAALGRMSIAKTFEGDLVGTSKGEMLMVRTPVEGSAGYVAIERVTATIGGRSGSFLLQHHATMDRGAPQLSITVVPDSGAGDLTGITGRMTIDIKDGKHFYSFEYALPEK